MQSGFSSIAKSRLKCFYGTFATVLGFVRYPHSNSPPDMCCVYLWFAICSMSTGSYCCLPTIIVRMVSFVVRCLMDSVFDPPHH